MTRRFALQTRPLSFRLAEFRLDRQRAIADFRPNHVEPLLNQIADLADRCWATITELESLRRTDFAFRNQLDLDQRLLELDEARREAPDREVRAHERTLQGIADGQHSWGGVLMHANTLWNASNSNAAAGQNLSEKRVDDAERNARRDLTELRRSWAVEDAAHLREVLRARRQSVDARSGALEAGGACDLQPKIDVLLALLFADFKDAANRAFIAERGLREIYGASNSEVSLLQLRESEVEADDIGKLLLWSRQAMEWIVAYGQRDQAFTRVVSVRSAMKSDAWKDIVTDGGISFWVDHGLFKDHDNVRLRGVSAHLLGTAGKVPWAAKLQLPSEAVYSRGDRLLPANAGEPFRCMCGRVENVRSSRPPEVCGQISLLNASPLGQSQEQRRSRWTISMQKPASDDERLSNVDDVLVELHCVGVQKGSQP
jgi:hypothetical protein